MHPYRPRSTEHLLGLLLTLRELGPSAAGLRHVVTVRSFTAEDPFPRPPLVVSGLGEPDAPAQNRPGADVREDAAITVASPERNLSETPTPPLAVPA